MRELPSEQVTVLFTDIEGSTRLIEELGESGYIEALAEHRRLLRAAFGAHGGEEVDTQGDAFLYAFADPTAALIAAARGQDALSAGPIKVRMGLHTGLLQLTDEGYAGRELHRAARIAASGHGGQVVVSAATRALVERELMELGEHRLKDFDEPVALFQLGTLCFPPLKTISNTNLPRPASSFVGRERELDELLARIEGGARLLTLTGPGGSGKTRLAIEAAAGLVASFKAGVFWVGLASLRDSSLVMEAIAQTLGAKDGLAEHIGERELLLLLDNFEQVVDAAPALVSLLESCPNLRVLVTSRELLRVRGEVEYPVAPLAQPEAVELFCTRAQLDPSGDIAELCHRLDSLPLAVELAAARTSVLSPAQILNRLSQRLDLLRGGRDAESRQRTLRATIQWSYDLLTLDERRLFARLAVFAGGCRLETAESVCGAELDTMQSLVDKSLLRHTDERFWMLETIRELALERLEESGEAADIGQRHAAYFLELGEQAKPELHARASPVWLDRLEAEHDNIRAVLGDALEHGRPEVALRLGAAAFDFWFDRGYWSEGRRWLEPALAAATDPHLRADALSGAGLLAVWQGDLDRGRTASEELYTLAEQTGSILARANAAMIAGFVTDDVEEQVRRQTEATELARELGDPALIAHCANNMANVELGRGEHERALELFEESLAAGRELGNQDLIARALLNLGFATLLLADVNEARPLLREGLNTARELGQMQGFIYGFSSLAAAYALDDPLRATRLLGRADALCDETSSGLEPLESYVRDQTEAQLQASLGEDAYAAAYAEGRALTLEDALTLALNVT